MKKKKEANNNKKKNEKMYTNNIAKEKTNKNEKEKRKSEPKQNKPQLKSIVAYHDTNQDGEMELNIGCPTIKTKKYSYLFFDQRFVHQTFL